MALTEKLTAIAEGFRESRGTTDKLTLDAMATLAAEPIGGGGGEYFTDEELVFTGNVSHMFSYDKWKNVLEKEKGRIKLKNVSNLSNFLSYSTDEDYSYLTIEGDGTTTCGTSNMFDSCHNLRKIPKIRNIYVNSNQAINTFSNMHNFNDTNDIIEFFENNTFNNNTLQGFPIGGSMYSLRNIDLAMPYISNAFADYNKGANYGGLCYCWYALDEINNIPVLGGIRTNNSFNAVFSGASRVKNITFETNNGMPIVAQWKSQTIDLVGSSAPVGVFYQYTEIKKLTGYNSGITEADKAPTTDFATFSAFIEANPDNWWTDSVYWARYNRESAIKTINSLPDTSAYLASSGGTNTIKFKSTQGSSTLCTDGTSGKIGNLTAEEIAVATAKGWTVSFA